jgi:hypothetical protein
VPDKEAQLCGDFSKKEKNIKLKELYKENIYPNSVQFSLPLS